MSKIAFIYPGQGAQQCGMGKDFYEQSEVYKEYFDQVAETMDFDLKQICFEENTDINETEFTQPAMVATCVGITRVLKDKGLKPSVAAGLSLGEYAALAATGSMAEVEAVQLVRQRGRLMQEAAERNAGAMSAVIGMKAEQIEDVLADIEGVSIANYNCPGQIVITGTTEGVTTAQEALKEAGARRVLPLKVSGPFHSALMKSASEGLEKVLSEVELQSLEIPYVSNVTAQFVTDKEEVKGFLTKGVVSSVRWQQSIEEMIEAGVDTFVEIGPGKTLTGFMKKINGAVTVKNVASMEDLEKVVGELC